MREFGFEIKFTDTSEHVKTYWFVLYHDSRADRHERLEEWMRQLNQQSPLFLTKLDNFHEPHELSADEPLILQMLGLEGNDRCADCEFNLVKAKHPHDVHFLTRYGVVICKDCAKWHRADGRTGRVINNQMLWT